MALVALFDRRESGWICEVAETHGFVTASVSDPLALPSLIRSEEPRLLIVDMAMIFPGMSSILNRVRAVHPDATAIVVLPEDVISEQGRQDVATALGFDSYLAHPVTPATVSALLEGSVGGGGVSLNGC